MNNDFPYISNTDFGKNIDNNNVPLEKYIQIINDYNNLDMKYSKLKINYKELIEKFLKHMKIIFHIMLMMIQ